MTALTGPRNTPERSATTRTVPAAAGHVFHPGAIGAIDTSTGYAVRATNASGLRGLGRVERHVDTTGLNDGDRHVAMVAGTFRYAGDGSIDRTQIGQPASIVDDQTVGTGGSATAGTIFDVDDVGVWVTFE